MADKEKEVSDLTVKLELALAENKKYSEKIAEYDEKSEKGTCGAGFGVGECSIRNVFIEVQ